MYLLMVCLAQMDINVLDINLLDGSTFPPNVRAFRPDLSAVL